jgi:glc operon protein GlcG
MTVTRETLTLTHSGAMAALAAAIAQAGATKVPQCIFLVDVSGECDCKRSNGRSQISEHAYRSRHLAC